MSSAIKLSSSATGQFWQIPICYEDDDLLALDKPAGLLTTPDRRAPEQPSLMALVHAGIESGVPWSKQSGRIYLRLAQRLDAEASGLVLLAKNKPALVALLNWFGAQPPGRSYVALVHGAPAEDRFKNGAKLAADPVQPGAFRVDPRHGKISHTSFEVLEKFAGCTLLKCEALTDRAHQIRVHLRNLGLPVVGDELYGGRLLLLSRLKAGYRLKPHRTERPLLAFPALHAETLDLPHPLTGAPLAIRAAWPKDLSVAVKYLRRYASITTPAN